MRQKYVIYLFLTIIPMLVSGCPRVTLQSSPIETQGPVKVTTTDQIVVTVYPSQTVTPSSLLPMHTPIVAPSPVMTPTSVLSANITDNRNVSSTFIFNAPVENFINAETIEELTIYSGDPPDVKEKKSIQRAKLIASDVLYYIWNIDARLGLVETALLPDDFGKKLQDANSQVAPAAQDIFESAYQQLITTGNIEALRQQLNSYPLSANSNPLMLELIMDSEVEPSSMQFFYTQISEVQWATEILFDTLFQSAEIDNEHPNRAEWIKYYGKRTRLAIDTLKNRSSIAYLVGLDILKNLPETHSEANTRLAYLGHLEPIKITEDSKIDILLANLLTEAQNLTNQRQILVEEGQRLNDQLLEEYVGINKLLVINDTDTQEVVVAKAITLRQLGRVEEAVAAFVKYEEMFTKVDPTTKQYAHVARQFTQKIELLGLEDGAVYIYDLLDKSPAAEGGLIIGDIITGLNEQSITNIEDFLVAVQNIPSGEPVNIVFLRLNNDNVFQRQEITIVRQNPLGVYIMRI